MRLFIPWFYVQKWSVRIFLSNLYNSSLDCVHTQNVACAVSDKPLLYVYRIWTQNENTDLFPIMLSQSYLSRYCCERSCPHWDNRRPMKSVLWWIHAVGVGSFYGTRLSAFSKRTDTHAIKRIDARCKMFSKLAETFLSFYLRNSRGPPQNVSIHIGISSIKSIDALPVGFSWAAY